MTNPGKTSLSIDVITARAELLKTLRDFMSKKGVLEIETPYLSSASNTDPNIINLELATRSHPEHKWFLHSSPEFPMKRLLASGIGSIYQICRVFRDEEIGRLHNSEFTMLEYYRVGFDHHELMNELNELFVQLGFKAAERKSYQAAFIEYGEIDPFQAKTSELMLKAKSLGFHNTGSNRNTYLDFLFSQLVISKLGIEQPCFIYDYPSEQAALSKVRYDGDYKVSERFEVFINGLEIANAYHELNDASELKQRFENDIEYCKKNNLPYGPMDKHLLNTTNDLPGCAGVAIGIDRLLMTILKLEDINQVLCFSSTQA